METIGFLSLAHPDYVSDEYAAAFTDRAAAAIRERGIPLHYSGNLITDTRSAAEESKALLRAGCAGVILFLATWMECPIAMTAVCELKNLPLMLWSFPMWNEDGMEKSTGSYVSHTMFRGVLERVSHPFSETIGMPGETETMEKIFSFCRAASAKNRLKYAKIGLVGYTSISIYPGTFDHVLMRWKIGPEIDQSDSYSLIRRAEKFNISEKKAALDLLNSKASCLDTIDPARLDKAMGLYLAIEELRTQTGLDAINIKCQYEFSKEYGMTVCVPLSLAASDTFVTSCEGDILCTVSMLILQYLTGQVIAYGDAITHSGNTLKLSPCGFMPYQLAGSTPIVDEFNAPGFTGLQNCFTMKPGKVTLIRLVEDIGSYHIVCTTGEGLASSKMRCGRFPSLDIVPGCNMMDLAKQYAGQHYALCYGDVTDDLACLSSMLGIECRKI